jgi:hypothetical protein
MKQTAVEWLEMEIVKLEAKYAIVGEIYELCEQAKEMEKQQIINVVEYYCPDTSEAEQYYNETFKSE